MAATQPEQRILNVPKHKNLKIDLEKKQKENEENPNTKSLG